MSKLGYYTKTFSFIDYLTKLTGISNDEEMELVWKYTNSLSEFPCTIEQCLFHMFGKGGSGELALGEIIDEDFHVPIAFFYGQDDWL